MCSLIVKNLLFSLTNQNEKFSEKKYQSCNNKDLVWIFLMWFEYARRRYLNQNELKNELLKMRTITKSQKHRLGTHGLDFFPMWFKSAPLRGSDTYI